MKRFLVVLDFNNGISGVDNFGFIYAQDSDEARSKFAKAYGLVGGSYIRVMDVPEGDGEDWLWYNRG